MSKTDTIRKRRVDVYLDSIEKKKEWKEAAEEEGVSLSKFVQHCVESAMNRKRSDLAEANSPKKGIDELREEISELKKNLKSREEIIETVGDAVFITTLGGNNHGEIMGANEAAVQQTGFSRGELMGKDIHDTVVRHSGGEDNESVREKLLEGETVTSTILRRKKVGITTGPRRL